MAIPRNRRPRPRSGVEACRSTSISSLCSRRIVPRRTPSACALASGRTTAATSSRTSSARPSPRLDLEPLGGADEGREASARPPARHAPHGSHAHAGRRDPAGGRPGDARTLAREHHTRDLRTRAAHDGSGRVRRCQRACSEPGAKTSSSCGAPSPVTSPHRVTNG